jgi:DNA-binding NarL/FixJ family response regulator
MPILSCAGNSCYRLPVTRSAQAPIRIVLVDDHPVVVKGLQALFRSEADLQVVASCRTGAEGLRAVRQHNPDIVILDIRMPDLDGFGMLRALDGETRPTRVILLTAEIDEHATLEAVRLGVHGIVLKDMPAHLLLECVRKVHAGEHWMETRSAGRAMTGLMQRDAALQEVSRVLTSREIEVVRMLARGLRSSSIASELHISEGTVKTHLHRIYEKLGVDGRVNLILLAREKGLA